MFVSLQLDSIKDQTVEASLGLLIQPSHPVHHRSFPRCIPEETVSHQTAQAVRRTPNSPCGRTSHMMVKKCSWEVRHGPMTSRFDMFDGRPQSVGGQLHQSNVRRSFRWPTTSWCRCGRVRKQFWGSELEVKLGDPTIWLIREKAVLRWSQGNSPGQPHPMEREMHGAELPAT